VLRPAAGAARRYDPAVAYDGALADRVRGMLAGAGASEKRMFGGLAFLLAGNMSVAVSGQGGLLVRVPPEDTEALAAEPGAEAADMGRGPMKGWLRVAGAVLADDEVLQTWVDRGLDYARTLPAK
jgi:TfoX/Sxy family transcriptional regulator of competence genes